MKKIILIMIIFSLVVFGEVKRATYEEIKTSINLIEKYIKEQEEDIIPILTEAIEIEKRATTDYFAKKIKEKICKTSKIKEEEFYNLRENFSFFDISIGWALSQVKNIPIVKLLKEKELKTWEEVLKENIALKEKIIKKIRELNPKSETF